MKPSKKQFLYLLVLLGVFPTWVYGQNSATSAATDTEPAFIRKSTDIRRTTLPPVIDGVIDDEIWQQATVITDLHQALSD